jgi:hypothetical protein
MKRRDRRVSMNLIPNFSIEFNEIVKIYDQRFEECKSKAQKLLEASKTVKKKEQTEHLKQEASKMIE